MGFWLGKMALRLHRGKVLAMGARELRDAFNQTAAPAASCSVALLEYERAHDTEFQYLYFSGSYADGSGFAIKSDPIRPNGDVLEMVKATAERVLQQRVIP
jgi:hypothetical protein